MTTRAGAVRIGLSGWAYPPWRGVFYPKGLAQKKELAYAARQFPTIEINGTFYGLQRPDTFAAWADQVPDGFVFSVKGPRFITHMQRLLDVRAPLANFIASGLLRLGEKLGPILWQLPPGLQFEPERLEPFLAMLPHSTAEAVRLGRDHDGHLKTPAWLEIAGDAPMRHAMEVRHDSFRDQAFIDMLRRHDIALVCADTVAWPLLMDLTSGFVYCRLHGSQELYASGYDDAALDGWARRVTAWARGEEPADAVRIGGKATPMRRDVYVYFDNSMKAKAPEDARGLVRRLGRSGGLTGAAPARGRAVAVRSSMHGQ
jgi:uncharacterized protein YecE (DUF72 family)